MIEKPDFLVTGTSSGLGQYLKEEFSGARFSRENIPIYLEFHKRGGYKCIIHCATDARNKISSSDLFAYYQSHIELLEQLLTIPHQLFVFVSSVAVYPYPFRLNKESDVLTLPGIPYHGEETHLLYGLFKLLAEEIVTKRAKRYLILRPTSIVGRTARQNNIMKILRGDSSPLSLSAESSYNLVSMGQIKRFIERVLEQNITGVFNIGAIDNVSLGKIAEVVGSQPIFGSHRHNVHMIDTSSIRSVSDDFNKSTLEVAREVKGEL